MIGKWLDMVAGSITLAGVTRTLLAALATVLSLVLVGTATADGLSPSVAHVRVGGVELGYRVAGPPDARPLLLIMGFSGTMAEWDPALVRGLARTRRVIAFDNRGMGTSSWKPGVQLTISKMADDTWRLIRALGLQRADVLGWSMGGNIAQQLVLRHPEVVRRLVLAATDPGSPHAILPTGAAAALLNSPGASIDELVSLIFPSSPSGLSASRRYLAAVESQPGIRGGWFRAPNAVVAEQILAEGTRWLAPGRGAYVGLPRVQTPTLVLDGAEDLLEPPQNSHLLASRIPGARLTIYPGAGHAFLFQYHARVARQILAFLY
jgi:pimeloyl-ACP methyl ester carboxylesterase